MEYMNFTPADISGALQKEIQNSREEATDKRVTGVVLDSRLVTSGGVFVATPGERVDGHSFIGQVFEKGAVLVITEKTPAQVEAEHGISADSWGPYILVEDSFAALKIIGEAYRKSLQIPIVGITGSVGKTSTKEFVAGVLSAHFNVLKTEKNFNNEVGVPLTLLSLRPCHEVAVIEMGISDFGEMDRLARMVVPDIMLITNIGQCHLEKLGDRDGILRAKTECFAHMKQDGEVCLFAGDDKLAGIAQVHGKKPHFFGVEGRCLAEAEMMAAQITSKGLLGSEFLLNGETLVKVPLPGYHMVVNATAAALVGKLLGLSKEEILSGIQGMQPISGRNSILGLKDITVIDDCYNANPVSMKSSIDLLNMGEGETIAVLGDMFELGEKEEQLHFSVGAYAVQEGIHRIYCIGKLSEHMYEGARETSEEKSACCKAGTRWISHWNSKADFMDAIREDFGKPAEERKLIPAGASVLIKASHGMHFEEITELFKKLEE